jgi:NADH-quinone oxidoreductase subunit L
VLSFAALLTAFYTFRMVFVAFFTSNTREKTYRESEIHAPGWRMVVPMSILAVPTLLGYFFVELTHQLPGGHVGGHGYHTLVMGVSVTVSLLGILLAYLFYVGEIVDLEDLTLAPVRSFVRDQYYVEVLYQNAIVKPLRSLSNGFWVILDDLIVDGLVNLTGAAVDISGLVVRFIQTGSIRHYVVYITTGFTLLISFIAYFGLLI